MKYSIGFALVIYAAQSFAVDCKKIDTSASGKTVTTNFSLSHKHAHLIKTCTMPPRGTCSFIDEADAVYAVTSQQYDPKVVELTKVSGDGPDTLTWKVGTYQQPCWRCSEDPAPVTSGTLFDGEKQLCKTRL